MESNSITFDEWAEFFRRHHDEAVNMSHKLLMIENYQKRAERMNHCCSYATGRYCPSCKTFHVTRASRCRDRLCPNCGWALARERLHRMERTLDALPGVALVHVVLTMQHDEDPMHLPANVGKLLRAFTRLMQTRRLKSALKGASRSLEVMNDSGGIHPHLHCLFFVGPEYWKKPITTEELAHLWKIALNVDYTPVCWMKLAYSKETAAADEEAETAYRHAMFECMKYTMKSQDLMELEPWELEAVADAVQGRQTFAVTGRAVSRAWMRAKERPTEGADATRCETCGGETVYRAIDLDARPTE